MNLGNPFRTTLLVISIFGAGLGVILLLFGAAAGNSASRTFSSDTAVSALAAVGIGASLLQLGAICFLLWLVVSAIGWRAGHQTEPTASAHQTDEKEFATDEGSWMDEDGV